MLILAIGGGVYFWARKPPSQLPVAGEITRLTADAGLTHQPSISRDGTLVAYASDRAGEGHLDIWVQQTGWGEPVRVTDHAADDREPDLSPDGTLVVFHSDRDGGGIYIAPTLGGPATLLARSGRRPRFSPGGDRVLFVTGGLLAEIRRIFWVHSEGGEPIRLAPQLYGAAFPVWSPGGDLVLFLGFTAGDEPEREMTDWWLAPLDGGAPHPTGVVNALPSRTLGAPAPERWLPGGEVVFVRGSSFIQESPQGDVWAVSISPRDGSVQGEPRQISSGADLQGDPSFAADGTMAFSQVELNPDIWMAPLDHARGISEGPLKRLTHSKTWDSVPKASQDGSQVVFRSDRAGGYDFWVVDVTTGEERRITRSETYKVDAAPSPDFSAIAFVDYGKKALYLASLSGDTRELCSNCGKSWGWTPDGAQIIANDNADRRLYVDTNSGVVLVDPGTGEKTLILDRLPQEPRNAVLSPNARWLTFSATTSDSRGQWLAPFLGTKRIPPDQWRRIMDVFGSRVVWSLASDRIYFAFRHEGYSCVFTLGINSETGAAEADPTPVRHFHDPRYVLAGGQSVSNDRLFVGLHERMSNIWLRRPLDTE